MMLDPRSFAGGTSVGPSNAFVCAVLMFENASAPSDGSHQRSTEAQPERGARIQLRYAAIHTLLSAGVSISVISLDHSRSA
jgi:hypothetical protein